MNRQYLPPDSTGLINCIPVKAIRTNTIRKPDAEFICKKCFFNTIPFKCDALCPCRPACMANDPDNIDKVSIIFVSVEEIIEVENN